MLSLQKTNCKYERSGTIPIPSKSKTKDLDEEIYCYEKDLQSNFFNPHKGSPPNSWSARLIERLGSSYKEPAHLTMFERK